MKNEIEANSFNYYFSVVRNHKLLTREEEIALAKRVEKKDRFAFEKMVNSNLRLVIKIAKYYATKEWQLDDLIQEGNIGLMLAVEKFDYRKKVKFSTYATWWIKQAIIRSIDNKKRVIRLPHRKEYNLRQMKKSMHELQQILNRTPSIEEIANDLRLNRKKVRELQRLESDVVSIDAEVMEGVSAVNFIKDDCPSPEEETLRNELVRETKKIFMKLKDQERYVLLNRFAFACPKKITLKDLGKELNMSPENVRQLEVKALNKIKQEHAYLRDYLI